MYFSFLIDASLLQMGPCSFYFQASGEAESSGIIHLGVILNILTDIGARMN